jgi:hypothetical protein
MEGLGVTIGLRSGIWAFKQTEWIERICSEELIDAVGDY